MSTDVSSDWKVEYYPATPWTVPPRDDFGHLVYARGYAYSRGLDPLLPEFWRETTFADGTFRWDPRVPLAKATSGSSQVLFCGNAISTTREQDDPRELAETLLRALVEDRTGYLDELEEFSGQYVVLDTTGGATRVQTDAIGSRAAFHDSEATVVASHADIVGAAIGARPSKFLEWVVRPATHDFPGRTTAFDGVWLLMPNTEVLLGVGEVTRIGPRPFEPVSVQQARREIIPLLQVQVRLLLAGHRKVIVSASAGVDSRTSLAAFSNAGDLVEVFTYTKEPGAGHQASELHRDRLAADMCRDLGLPHRLFHLDRQEAPPKSYVEALSSSSIRRSNALTSWTYHEHLPHNAVHIRGQINGVGKWHFAKRLHFTEPLELSARRMAELTKRGRSLRHNPRSPVWRIAEEGFQEYIDATNLRSVPNGYRIPDLFLWEHRVGYWNHAHIVESDVTFDTHQIFASRRIIRLMLSVPEIDRVQLTLFRDIIQELEPKLLEYKLNGVTWSEPSRDLPLSHFQSGITRDKRELSEARKNLSQAGSLAEEETAVISKLESQRKELASQVQALTDALQDTETRRLAIAESKLGRLQEGYWSMRRRWRRGHGRH